MALPKLTRRAFLNISGLNILGYALLDLSACRKAPSVSSQERTKTEQGILDLLQEIRSNRSIKEISFKGERLRLGLDDVARKFNLELERVRSGKRVFFVKELEFPAEILFGEAVRHARIKDADALIFNENEIVSTLNEDIYGRSNTLWKMTAIRKRGCGRLWSEFGNSAFEEMDPISIELLKLYGVRNQNELITKRKQAIEDLSECILRHELTHQERKYFVPGFMSSIRFPSGTNHLLDLLEMRAELGALNHIISIKSRAKAARLAVLWSLSARKAKSPHKAVLFLIMVSSMEIDPQTGKINFNLDRLTSVTKKFSKRLDEGIASIESEIKRKISGSLSEIELEAEKQNIWMELSSANYPRAKENWFMDDYLWRRMCKRPADKTQIQSVMKEEAISVLRELLNYPEIGGKDLSYRDLLYSIRVLIHTKLIDLKLQ